MNKNVEKLLKEKTWFLGTSDKEPNVVPVLFKDVTPEGQLLVGDVFLETTLKNIAKNGKIAVTVCDDKTLEGYQIKGTAKYLTEGPIVATFKQIVSATFKGAFTAKGALVITPEIFIVATPGPKNKEVL
jgi:predicted pyridoxine 5'-phosphate oxidase superfamily flavin-nucleotide-binding protein